MFLSNLQCLQVSVTLMKPLYKIPKPAVLFLRFCMSERYLFALSFLHISILTFSSSLCTPHVPSFFIFFSFHSLLFICLSWSPKLLQKDLPVTVTRIVRLYAIWTNNRCSKNVLSKIFARPFDWLCLEDVQLCIGPALFAKLQRTWNTVKF